MENISYTNISGLFTRTRCVPVVVLKTLEDTLPTLKALCDYGIPTAEITFRTACAADAIRLGREQLPDMLIGAGTIINAEQARAAIEAGAQFIVSPGIGVDIAQVCREADIPYIPGCVTPAEIMQALSLGITTVKFFPANVYGGMEAIKALSAPFPQVKFVPTGGVDSNNLDEFLACDKIAAVGGSFFVKLAMQGGKSEK